MKDKKVYLKKRYFLERTKKESAFYFPNNFCLKSNQSRKFQRLCLVKRAKAMFLPSSFKVCESPQSQGPSIYGVLLGSFGFSEIALMEECKQILSFHSAKQNLFIEKKKEKHESVQDYAQNFLFLTELQNKRVM